MLKVASGTIGQMLTNLFRLDGVPTLSPPAAMPSMSPGDTVANFDFRNRLWLKRPRSIRGVTFNNVGMSKTTFQRLTFNDCHFEDCLFVASRFREVEFHNCTFTNCNFWKAKFEHCYLDPDTIKFAERYKIEAANVGVTLYHSLLSNYSNERQDAFFAKADIRFRQWKRYQLARDLREQHISWWKGHWARLASFAYELTAGFGYKPARFFGLTLVLFLGISGLNHVLIGDAVSIAGERPGKASLVDSIFYSFSVLTVLGFSSIVPDTPMAKLLTVFEALGSIGWLSIFTSVLVKRFLR